MPRSKKKEEKNTEEITEKEGQTSEEFEEKEINIPEEVFETEEEEEEIHEPQVEGENEAKIRNFIYQYNNFIKLYLEPELAEIWYINSFEEGIIVEALLKASEKFPDWLEKFERVLYIVGIPGGFIAIIGFKIYRTVNYFKNQKEETEKEEKSLPSEIKKEEEPENFLDEEF